VFFGKKVGPEKRGGSLKSIGLVFQLGTGGKRALTELLFRYKGGNQSINANGVHPQTFSWYPSTLKRKGARLSPHRVQGPGQIYRSRLSVPLLKRSTQSAPQLEKSFD